MALQGKSMASKRKRGALLQQPGGAEPSKVQTLRRAIAEPDRIRMNQRIRLL
jgi:hypothetical protein